MSSERELGEHARYVTDRRRNDAYSRALAALVRPGDRVLDLGSGTGWLGMLALRAGAGVVYAVDEGPILGVAAQLADDNGFGDRLVAIRGRSTDVELPEPVDLVVADQLGGFAHEYGAFEVFVDAHRRLCAPGARFVPSAISLHVMAVEHPGLRARVERWRSDATPFDASRLADLAANTPCTFEHPRGHDVFEARTAPVLVADVPSAHGGTLAHHTMVPVTSAGRIDGLLGWFVAELAPGIAVTNDPRDVEAIDRWHTAFPVDPPLQADAGDELEIDVDVRPAGALSTWTLTLRRAGGEVERRRQSSFLGSFESGADLSRRAGWGA